jgi:hypothetical protein
MCSLFVPASLDAENSVPAAARKAYKIAFITESTGKENRVCSKN